MALNPGTSTQLAKRLRELADYGAARKPPPDSALAQFIAGARAYADYLTDDFGPRSGGIVVQGTTEVFRTADALAQSIVDEVMSGAYGDASPPPPEGASGGFPWLLAGAVVVGAGLVAYALTAKPRGRRVELAA